VTDRNNGLKILAVRQDESLADIAAALSLALYRDGQASPTANINWGGYKITNLADPTVALDALNLQTGDARYAAKDADLAAIAALGSTGFATRTAADTWAQRTISGTANEISVADGGGVAGNPTLSLPAAITLTGKTLTGGTFIGGTFSGAAVWNGSVVGIAYGGTGLSTLAQGELLYGSAANTLSALAKDANATRYLSNTGASNNPAWAQVNLANGVTGNLPVANLGSGTGATSATYWRGDGIWSTPTGAGDVVGPASVTDDLPAIFNGTTGKLIKQKTYAAFKTLLALVKGDVGLGNVDNTADTDKPVSTAQQAALDLKAYLAFPVFTGTPLAPTAAPNTNTTQIATTEFVTTADNLKAPLASPTFTGTPAAPTAAAATSTTQLATTAFVTTADNLKAPLASPTFTGTPAAPTAAALTNTTQIATTAYVRGEIGNGQIPFPATQNASADANTLDDYKEGTFTPALTALTTAPTGVTYTTQVGTYTKIGRLVSVSIILALNSKGSGGVGQVAVTGLPFTCGVAGHSASLITDILNPGSHGVVEVGETKIVYWVVASNTGFSAVTWSTLTAGSTWVRHSITYFV
jgi:hypothetical protein